MTAQHLHLVKNTLGPSDSQTQAATQAAGPARFLIRQPILDLNQRCAGYEIKLRDSVPVPVVPGAASMQQMRDEMLLSCALNSDLQQATGDRLFLFLTLAPETLFSPLMDFLPKANVIVSVASSESANHETRDRLAELARMGVRLSFDDMDHDVALRPSPAQCRYIRIDTAKYDTLGLGKRIDTLRGENPTAKLVALHVDTEEMRECCELLGFDFLQGKYLSELRAKTAATLDASRLRIMELLNLVIGHAETREIEEKFKTDPALSCRLLQYLNSPALMLRQPIQSLSHAVIYLGHEQLYRWLALLLFTGEKSTDPRGQALLRNVLVRARFTENLGQHYIPAARRGGLFIVGLLSMLDALLNLPMDKALANINLPDEMVSALLNRTGPLAPYLELAIACENFDQDAIGRCSEENGFNADEVNFAHVDALIWAERVLQS